MSDRFRSITLISAGLLVVMAWSPALARTNKGKPGLLQAVVRCIKNPAQFVRQQDRNNRAKMIRGWRARGLKVVKLGDGYLTSAKPRPPVKIPGNDYKGWLNALGGEGAWKQYLKGNMVRPVDLENGSWKLKAVIPTRGSSKPSIYYEVPSSISLGYKPSNASNYQGKQWVYYHADLRFTGKKNAKQRVFTNLHLTDLAGDLKAQKKSQYLDLDLDLPKSQVHSSGRVSLYGKLLSPTVMITSMGFVSGNQNTDQIAVYERQPAR